MKAFVEKRKPEFQGNKSRDVFIINNNKGYNHGF